MTIQRESFNFHCTVLIQGVTESIVFNAYWVTMHGCEEFLKVKTSASPISLSSYVYVPSVMRQMATIKYTIIEQSLQVHSFGIYSFTTASHSSQDFKKLFKMLQLAS